MSLTAPIGSLEGELGPALLKTSAITKANKAIPITRIKKKDRFRICPRTAITYFLLGAKIQFFNIKF